jgi:adenine-specific DNA methylase
MTSKQKDLGQYMTPIAIARQMVERFQSNPTDWKVIDPACGDGNLLIAVVERLREAQVPDIQKRIIGIDIDPEMAASARSRLAKAIGCHAELVQVVCDDFLRLANSPLLFGQLFSDCSSVISNPPYGKGREYEFLTVCNNVFPRGTELVFLMPLAYLDRVRDSAAGVLDGKPLGVTTGHCIAHHIAGRRIQLESVHRKASAATPFRVLSGVKLYEIGAGVPPQSSQLISEKPYSSDTARLEWLPCVRTGDIQPFEISLGRLYVNYGEHLAHPKEIGRFTGPRLFVRRVPIWGSRCLGSVFIEQTALCAGDVLVVRHISDDADLLKGLATFLNSPDAAELILNHRPSVRHRVSFPKISGKDLEWLFENNLPSERELQLLANSYGRSTKLANRKPTIYGDQKNGLRLLEVAFPIEEVSQAASREKSIRQGHISTLQMWWARRPMGVCRAALFASLCPAPAELTDSQEALNLLRDVPGETIHDQLQWLCGQLADWKAGADESILRIASALICLTQAERPCILDSFAGGGSIPVEAARLGLHALASDINPVAVIPLKLALELLPGAPQETLLLQRQIAAKITKRLKEMGKQLYGDSKATQHLAFFWCKTIECPECSEEIPLLKDKWLAKGTENWAVRVERGMGLRFTVYSPSTPAELKDADTAFISAGGATCPWCTAKVASAVLAELSRTGQMGDHLYAKLEKVNGRKVYRAVKPTDQQYAAGATLRDFANRRITTVPDSALDVNGIRHLWAIQYGVRSTRDLYSARQQVALLELVYEIEEMLSTVASQDRKLIQILLALTFNRVVMYGTRHVWWQPNGEFPANMYVRQGIAMVWSYVEIPISSPGAGAWHSASNWIEKVVEHLSLLPSKGLAWMADAAETSLPANSVDLVAIDPPYFDSITYAYLSDPFYVWMKALLGDLFKAEFSSEVSEKANEAIVDRPHKLATNPKTGEHFRRKMEAAFREAKRVLKPNGRLLLMYGHKKIEAWEAVLSPLLEAGFVPTVSWPISMERKVKFRHGRIDALSASCLIFCEPATATEKQDTTWEEIQPEMRASMRRALFRYQSANFMGTDLASAIIAPAAAILQRFRIRHQNGDCWTVRELLGKLPDMAKECEVEAVGNIDSEDAFGILATLKSIPSDQLISAGKNPGWTAVGPAHGAILRAANYVEALYRGDMAEADRIWTQLDGAGQENLCMVLRAAALISPPGSLGRQLAHAGLGRATMQLRVN